MAGYARVIRQKNHLLPIGRNMRKPVVELVEGHLLLLASISPHPPDLHVPSALAVEINIFPVRRIFRAIIEALGLRQLRLFAACGRNRVDIELLIPLTNESQRLSVRRPPMPVRRRLLRDAPWRPAADGHDIDERAMLLLRLVADDQLRAIRRNSMIVVASDREAR